MISAARDRLLNLDHQCLRLQASVQRFLLRDCSQHGDSSLTARLALKQRILAAFEAVSEWLFGCLRDIHAAMVIGTLELISGVQQSVSGLHEQGLVESCLLYTSPSPRDRG